jgi:hypothetical protein
MLATNGTGMTKNRKGRKRKTVARREPNGREKRRPADYRAMAAAWPVRRDLAAADRASERAGSVLGRLSLKKLISEPQYDAGQRYAVIVGAYRAMIGMPGNLAGGGKGYDCIGAADCPADSCVCLARTKRYDDAYCAVRTHAAHLAVNAVAIHDQDIPPYQLDHLREGLEALAWHFGILGKRRRAS